MKVNKKFLCDDSHGWLSVKRKELVELGIENEISAFSYQRGQSVYLEEDCDAPVYIDAQKKNGVSVVIIEGKQSRRSPVRSYKTYSKG